MILGASVSMLRQFHQRQQWLAPACHWCRHPYCTLDTADLTPQTPDRWRFKPSDRVSAAGRKICSHEQEGCSGVRGVQANCRSTHSRCFSPTSSFYKARNVQQASDSASLAMPVPLLPEAQSVGNQYG
jgi:hypothetical protein